jgi:glycosyltransferase involved in cell wall biosynthesis
MLLRQASLMIAQSEEMATEMRQLVRLDQIVVLHNPVILRQGAKHDGLPRATYAGRLSIFKDLPRLLEAWRQFSQDRPTARLTLVGSGGSYASVEAELRAIVDNDERLRKNVSFTGWVVDISPYLDAADVFVLPSTSEGMSNALVEACASQRIVVASDIPPNREVLGSDYPLLFRVGSTSDLVQKLTLAFDDQRVRCEALRLIDQRIQHHDLAKIVEKFERLLVAVS